MKIEWTKPAELTLGELADLIGGAKACTWDNVSVEDLIGAEKENAVYFYRISGKASGIIVARPNWKADRFEILLVVGKGCIKAMPEIRGELAMIAKGLGLNNLAGWVSRGGLMAMYDKHTSAKPVATLYVEAV